MRYTQTQLASPVKWRAQHVQRFSYHSVSNRLGGEATHDMQGLVLPRFWAEESAVDLQPGPPRHRSGREGHPAKTLRGCNIYFRGGVNPAAEKASEEKFCMELLRSVHLVPNWKVGYLRGPRRAATFLNGARR